MASMTIEVESEDAAFDGCENAAAEMARLLRSIADTLDEGVGPCHVLYDINGNKCGSVATDLGEDEDEEGDEG